MEQLEKKVQEQWDIKKKVEEECFKEYSDKLNEMRL